MQYFWPCGPMINPIFKNGIKMPVSNGHLNESSIEICEAGLYQTSNCFFDGRKMYSTTKKMKQ
jgi:hypothetical protein